MAQSKAFADASHALNDLSHALALLEAENAKLREEGQASGFQWHLMADEAPEYGANDFVVMGMRGAMYLASKFIAGEFSEYAYFYIPNRRSNFMDKKQVLAWAEIPPLEVD